jgi:hypothetical protein
MSEGWFVSRRKGILIPSFIMPTYGIERDGREIHLVVYRRDGTIICKYPLKYSPLIKHPELFKEETKYETSWAFGSLIYRYRRRRGIDEPELIPMDQVAIHPYNIRYIPIEDRKDSPHFRQLVDMAKSRTLINPVLAAPLDNNTKKILKDITEQAEKHGLNSENILAGILWKWVRWKGDKLVAREDDEVHSLISSKFGPTDGEIKYLIIDGYQRFVAQYYAFRDTIDSWKSPPYVYAHVLEEGIDVLSLAYISRTINLYERSIAYDLDAMSTFANLFELGDSLLELGNMVGFEDYIEAGDYLRSRRISTPEVVKGIKFSMVPVELGEKETAAVEEEPEEERKEGKERKRREEPLRPGASAFQRQPTPTLSYVPAQPQAPVQLPISPLAQPIREEVQRPGALPGAADVLAGILKYRKQTLSQLAFGNEAKLTIDFSHLHPTLQHRIAKELGSLKLERTVVAVPFDKLSMKLNDIELLTSGYFLFYKTKQGLLECPNPRCRALIPLGPIRCPSCGQLIENMSLLPFPYEFSFE